MHEDILKGSKESKQHIGKDTLNSNGTIDPFINFEELLSFYYANVYHQRSVKLKAALLSQIKDTNLDKFIPEYETAKELLYGFALDAELYGNAFLERAGTKTDYYLYHILGYQGRLNKRKEIFQLDTEDNALKMEGHHFKYYSPSGKYYGEPDYLATLEQILTSKKADTFNTAFFDNGARPGYGIIFENSAPSEEQKKAFQEFFSQNYKGYSNAHKSLVLYTGKPKEGAPPSKVRLEKLDGVEDMSFEKLKKVNRDDIIAAHGVPPRLVGVMAAGQLGGGGELIDQLHAFNEIIIKPKANLIQSFFENIGITLEIESIDVTNFKDDSSLIANLVDKQILSQVEAKEILGFNSK
ncbi:portal protein [Malaciobacter canalis]|uniref:Portal protein n=1 Tax=Malaciobacter canalis TaxID=1912871 RepID=A0ABX4LU93_9BACT|nr:phage portal protein [Malaciobacter canalis]PHO09771.1 portal protein [Malaciobacter canalis]QEE33389.1 phage capsid portal protein, PBSX family [Malaciobacter canalis]